MLSRFLLSCCAVLSFVVAVQAADGFRLQDTAGDHLDVLYGDKIVARYMYAYDPARLTDTYKPYLHIFDAEGKSPITKGPGGLFPHHRAIFVGWKKMVVGDKSYDRWHMTGGDQIHQKFIQQQADANSATLTSLIHYETQGTDHPFLAEERTMTFRKPPAPAYVQVDVTSKLKPVGEAVTLDGDPEHSGIQFRPAAEVDTKQTTYLYPKENADPHKDKDYPWVAETFVLADKSYSVVDLNSPKNPKNTAFSAYRDYGRFGGFFKATIAKGEELTIRCRFVISTGKLPAADWIQKQYNDFNGVADATPAVKEKLSEQPKPKAPAAKPAKPKDPAKTTGSAS